MFDSIIPTVKIKHPGGYAIINECDFDPKVHERFVEPPPAAPKMVPPPPPMPTPPADPLAKLAPNWQREMKSADLRKIVEQVTGRTPENREQSVQLIEAALAARAAK